MDDALISEIVALAWDDATAFDMIEAQYGLNESAVIALMRLHMKPSSFRMWRKRVSGRKTKHSAKSARQINAKASGQVDGLSLYSEDE